jgi:biotin operon repressor
MTESEILVAADYIYNNAKDNTQNQLAEKLNLSPSRIAQLINLMKKAGVPIQTAGGQMGLYRSTISKWAAGKVE